jgi:ATP-dependent Lhr-like helicase
LAGRDPDVRLSRRAQERLAELREEMAFVSDDGSSLVTHDAGDLRWWTFAGRGANAVLAQALARSLGAVRRIDNFSLQIAPTHLTSTEILERLRASDIAEPVWEDWMAQVQLKFERCLPETLAHQAILARLTDLAGARAARHEPIRVVGFR